MWITEKCGSEAGVNWHVMRITLCFYPTFWSRFTGYDEALTIREKFANCEYEDRGRARGDSLRRYERFKALYLSKDGPEVRDWMRENLTGRAQIFIRRDWHYDVYGHSDQKTFEARFHQSTDAVAFKLALL